MQRRNKFIKIISFLIERSVDQNAQLLLTPVNGEVK